MPVAVADYSDETRFELKTCKGGYVVLRRMTYGQTLERREMMKLSVATEGKGKNSKLAGELAMASKAVARYEFAKCIVDHNLTDKEERKLDLAGADFEKLHPKIGQEIDSYISDMNNFEDDEDEAGNSKPAS